MNKAHQFIFSLLIILVFGCNNNAIGQAKAAIDTNLKITTDTTNLARRLNISEEDFLFQVNRFVDIMKNRKPIQTIDDYIIVVRIFNTLFFGLRYQKSNPTFLQNDTFPVFFDLFFNKHDPIYLDATIQNLHCFSRKGGEGWKSTDYHIGIGFSNFEPINEYDYYHIISK